MSTNTDLIYDIKRKMLAKYPRFGSEIATSSIVFTNQVSTGSTDGKNIYLNPQYFASVNEDVRLYLLAHETFHKKFMHMYRLKDKNGDMRDSKLWNIVCDALVNANLKRDGIKIPDGRICSNTDEEYGDWVLQYNCEELYELKKREKEKKQNEQSNEKSQENGEGQSQEQDSGQGNRQQNQEQIEQENGQDNNNENLDKNENQNGGDDHSLWKEAFEQQFEQNSEEKTQKQESNSKEQDESQEQKGKAPTNMDFDEREEFEENRREKREKFKSRREKTEKEIRGEQEGIINLGDIGESKKLIGKC